MSRRSSKDRRSSNEKKSSSDKKSSKDKKSSNDKQSNSDRRTSNDKKAVSSNDSLLKVLKKKQGGSSSLEDLGKLRSMTSMPVESMEQWVQDFRGLLYTHMDQVRKQPVTNWLPYLDNDHITHKEFSFVNAFQYTKNQEERDMLTEYFKDTSYKTILKIVRSVLVVDQIQRFLVLIYDLLFEDLDRAQKFYAEEDEPWRAFQDLLSCSDNFVSHISSRIMTKIIMGKSGKKPKASQVKFFLRWLKEEMREDNEYLQSVGRCLQTLLQEDDYRMAFMTLNGIVKIIKLMSGKIMPQNQYQFCFCLWVSTFNPLLAEKLSQTGTIPVMMDILERCPAEITKLPRVMLATFRNLLEKPRDKQVRRRHAMMLLQFKLLHCMEVLEHREELTDDPEFNENFQKIRKVLEELVKELTSFDEYYIELKSGRLQWSVVHTSKKFWMENAERLNDNKYELLKMLIKCLEDEGSNFNVQCIAAHDLGEYMKHYPRGKKVMQELGGKDVLVGMLNHDHPAVKYHVLKSLQVLMLDDYETYSEYLPMRSRESVESHGQAGKEEKDKEEKKD